MYKYVVMDCKEILKSEIEQLDLSKAVSVLVIGNLRKSRWLIDSLKVDNKEQHFKYMGFNTQQVAGHYDVAVIDGTDDKDFALQLFKDLFPYLKQNVKEFYIIT